MIASGQSWCMYSWLVRTALSIPTILFFVGAPWAITATLEQQVAAVRSVTVTPKALSTVTVTERLGSVSASQEPRGSAVRNACQDTSWWRATVFVGDSPVCVSSWVFLLTRL